MAQEVVILQGIGDEQPRADTAIAKLQAARANTQNLWARAWDLKWTAYKLAARAITLRDPALYQTAKDQNAEADRWMRVARDRISENDELRGKLYGDLRGKQSFSMEQIAWFSNPSGLSVPDAFLANRGGTPIPRFPEYR